MISNYELVLSIFDELNYSLLKMFQSIMNKYYIIVENMA